MAKGHFITESVEILIASVYDQHPQWTATKVQHMVSALLRKHNPDLPPDWPGLNSVQKVLAILRKKSREKEEDPLGKPWSIGMSHGHGIPADATPVVLEIWQSWEQSEAKGQRPDLNSRPSIREAQWIGRLRHVITDDIEALGRAAVIYARVEEYSEALEHPVFDSTGLDYAFMKSSRSMPFDVRAAVEHVRLRVTGSKDVDRPKALERERSTGQSGGSR